MATLEPPLTAGSGFTETITNASAVPQLLVPVTVYIVVTVGVAVTLVPVVADNPAPGIHTYVTPPVAESAADVPKHIATFDPAPTIGVAVTDTVTVAELLHPDEVPVTV